MKITLSTSLLDSILALAPATAMQVLSQCRQLTTLDNDAIEKLELPAHTHRIVLDLLADLKKRAAASRRRRQRREQLKAQSSAKNTAKQPLAEYQEALGLLFSEKPQLNARQYGLMVQFLNAMTKQLRLIAPQSSMQAQRQRSTQYFASLVGNRRRR